MMLMTLISGILGFRTSSTVSCSNYSIPHAFDGVPADGRLVPSGSPARAGDVSNLPTRRTGDRSVALRCGRGDGNEQMVAQTPDETEGAGAKGRPAEVC